MKFKEGDKVEVIDKKHGHCFQIGTKGIVTAVTTGGGSVEDYKVHNEDESDYWWLRGYELKLVE